MEENHLFKAVRFLPLPANCQAECQDSEIENFYRQIVANSPQNAYRMILFHENVFSTLIVQKSRNFKN